MAELLPHLGERAERLAGKAVEKLAARGKQESREMAELLKAQRSRIGKALDRRQMSLDFNDDEKRQLEAERQHQQKRLTALEREQRTEPERIQAIYAVKARRIEPVGIVYLWPVSG